MSEPALLIRTVLVDDHPLVIEGLQSCLESFPSIRVVGAAASAGEALDLIAAVRPDIALMDINMPGLNGLDAIEIITERTPETRILVLSMHENKAYVAAALGLGAKGYLLKDAPTTEIAAAIEAVARGETYLSEGVAALLASGGGVVEHALTTREQAVLLHLAEGLSNKEVALQLGISVHTVETHRKNIKRKTGVATAAGLTRFAIENGMLRLPN
ncbi:MAG: response regulator transcription factor [Pseudomonadota bacterium]